MHAKNKKGILPAVIALAVIGTISYFAFFRKKNLTKAQKVTFLLTSPNAAPGNNYNDLMTFGDDFIDAWYKAAKKGDITFGFQNKVYKTRGGRAA